MPGKLKLHASLGCVGDDCDDEVDLPSYWNELTQVERDAWCEDALAEHISQYLESSYEIVEDTP